MLAIKKIPHTVKTFRSRNSKVGLLGCHNFWLFGTPLNKIYETLVTVFRNTFAWSFNLPLEFQRCFKTPAVIVSKPQWFFETLSSISKHQTWSIKNHLKTEFRTPKSGGNPADPTFGGSISQQNTSCSSWSSP